MPSYPELLSNSTLLHVSLDMSESGRHGMMVAASMMIYSSQCSTEDPIIIQWRGVGDIAPPIFEFHHSGCLQVSQYRISLFYNLHAKINVRPPPQSKFASYINRILYCMTVSELSLRHHRMWSVNCHIYTWIIPISVHAHKATCVSATQSYSPWQNKKAIQIPRHQLWQFPTTSPSRPSAT